MNTKKNNNQKNKAPPAGPPVLRRQSASELLQQPRKMDVRTFYFNENEKDIAMQTGIKNKKKLKSHISKMWKALSDDDKKMWKKRLANPAWVEPTKRSTCKDECASKIQKMWRMVKEGRKCRETRRWLGLYLARSRAAIAAKDAAKSAVEAASLAMEAVDKIAKDIPKKLDVRTFYFNFLKFAIEEKTGLYGQKLKKYISAMWKLLDDKEKDEWRWLSKKVPSWLTKKICAVNDDTYLAGDVIPKMFREHAALMNAIRKTTGERWTFVRTSYHRFIDRPLRPICHWDPSIHKWRGARIDQILAGRQRKCVEDNENTMAILDMTRRVRYHHFKCCALITGHKSKISYALDSIFGTYEMSEEMMEEADKDWEKFMIAMYDMRGKPEWAHLVD